VLTGYAPSGLREGILLLNLVSLEASVHRVTPLPWCPLCGGAARRSVRPPVDKQSGATEDLLARLQQLYADSRTGIVREVALRDLGPDDPQVPLCARAAIAAPTSGTYCAPALEMTGGKGATAQEALLGAVAEGLERQTVGIG
jgi:ribosomal protein S12 methylthiotransferase accessory factor